MKQRGPIWIRPEDVTYTNTKRGLEFSITTPPSRSDIPPWHNNDSFHISGCFTPETCQSIVDRLQSYLDKQKASK